MTQAPWRAATASTIVLLASHAAAAAGCPYPSPTQIVAYRDANSLGPCWVLNQGSYPTPTQFANDAISSVYVGSAVNAEMFHDANFGGDIAFFPPGFHNVGSSANDSVSSIKVIANNGLAVAWDYLGDSGVPGGGITFAGTEVQGIAHDANYFYITYKDGIRKFGLDATLPPLEGRSYNVSLSDPTFQPLTNMNCSHFGDPDMLSVSGVNYLLVPVEGCTFPDIPDGCALSYDCQYASSETTALAVVDPNTLTLIAYDALYENDGHAAFVAVQGTSLWSSGVTVDGQNPILTYAIDTNSLYPDANPHFIVYGTPPLFLTHEDGTPVSMTNMQGGAFSSDGQVFYTSNGYGSQGRSFNCDASTQGADWGGIRVFNASTGTRLAESSLTYGLFQFEYHCGLPQLEEPEGLDFVNLGAWGVLHAIVYDNVNDDFWFKHYSF